MEHHALIREDDEVRRDRVRDAECLVPGSPVDAEVYQM